MWTVGMMQIVFAWVKERMTMIKTCSIESNESSFVVVPLMWLNYNCKHFSTNITLIWANFLSVYNFSDFDIFSWFYSAEISLFPLRSHFLICSSNWFCYFHWFVLTIQHQFVWFEYWIFFEFSHISHIAKNN